MKKFLLLIASVLTSMTMLAQADYFEFVDKDGNVVPDGTTLTLTEVTTEEDVFGEVTYTMYSNLYVRNKTSETRYLRINMFIDLTSFISGDGIRRSCFIDLYSIVQVGNKVVCSLTGPYLKFDRVNHLVFKNSDRCKIPLNTTT